MVYHCFTAFFGNRGHVDFAPSAELTRQVEKSTRRAYQAPMPVDLRHEQAHRLMVSMGLSRLDDPSLWTDHCFRRLLPNLVLWNGIPDYCAPRFPPSPERSIVFLSEITTVCDHPSPQLIGIRRGSRFVLPVLDQKHQVRDDFI